MDKRLLNIIAPFLLIPCLLTGADALLPETTFSQVQNGILVELHFEHISSAAWVEMLDDPETFAAFGYGVAGAPGEPALPMTNLMIPVHHPGNGLLQENHRVEEVLADIRLRPVPPAHLDSEITSVPPPTGYYEPMGSSTLHGGQVLPGSMVSRAGGKFLAVTLSPLRYDAAAQTLSIPRKLSFLLEGAELSQADDKPVQISRRSLADPSEMYPRRGHYLIITPPSFEPYLQGLTAWKRRMGHEVTVVTTAVTGTSRSMIKNYIQTAWDTWENRPDFLLLIGDSDQGMPGYYIQNNYGDNLIGDHPYTLLEGEDTFPELLVGRLSVDTYSELVAFTSKIVRYESMPPLEDPAWLERGLMICTTLGAASTRATKEWVSDKMLANGYDQIYTAYEPEVSSVNAISNPINLGVGFVNYRGFGYYSGWAGPYFTSWDVSSLIYNAGKTPIITSVVCGGGNFDAPDDPCFGEVWTRIGSSSVPRGAVAFFAPSELYTHTQFNNVIDIGIYSAIFDQGVQTLGEALWAGKYELWRNYHQNSYFPFAQTPEFYQHVYNLLGDPGMQMWTAIPRALNVVHADTLDSRQNSIEISVQDEAGQAIPEAYVSLLNDANAIGTYTNAAGEVTLPVDLEGSTNLMLTVTGKNLAPYLVTLPIRPAGSGLRLISWEVDTDSLPQAGATVPLHLQLENLGAALSDVTLAFASRHPGVSITEEVFIPEVVADGPLDPLTLHLTIDPDLEHGDAVVLDLDVYHAADSWHWQRSIIIQAPRLEIDEFILRSGVVNAGDSASFQISLVNQGGAPTDSFYVIPLEHELLSFSSEPLVFEPIGVDETGVSLAQFEVVFSDQIFPGERLDVGFIATSSARTDTLRASVEIGELIRFGPSRADDYGYRMFDEFDLSFSKAQSYDWVEISPAGGGNGSMLGITDSWEEDDASIVINLPFPVSYYGETFTTITVCTNGWAAFGAQDVVNFHNRIIPSPIGPTAMLAPFWDDLTTAYGRVYQYTSGDNGAFILQWDNMNHLYIDDRLSFQVIIYNTDQFPTDSGDSDIKFQYKLYENTDVLANFATIGIESPDSRTGLQASYNNIDDPSVAYLRNNTAILFSTDRGIRYQNASATVNSTTLHFQQNPWSTNRDSIVIINDGDTPVAFAFSMEEQSLPRQQPAVEPMDPSITKLSPDAASNSGGMREGTDSFGHYWARDIDPGGPVYTWYDIEVEANRLTWSGDPDDYAIGPISLGFEFPYYDDIYEQIYIGSNGTVSFESSFSPWLNRALPDQMSPPALIAAWWDDLNTDAGPFGSLYFWSNQNDQCIITWKDFPKWGTNQLYTFQLILYKIGMLVLQYEEMDPNTVSGTVAIQNSARDMGLTIYHNEITPPLSETAISIMRPVEWFSASNWSGRVEPGESEAFIIDVTTIGMPEGHYERALTIETSAPNFPRSDILVSMEIAPGDLPWGDINGDYQVNLNDAIRLRDHAIGRESMTSEEAARFDLSGDAEVNVLDVIILLEAILSVP